MDPTAHPPRPTALAALALCLFAPPVLAYEPPPPARHVAVYLGQNSPNRLLEIVRSVPDLRSSYLGAVAYGHTFAQSRNIRWELEGQLVNHWGMQSHWEANGVLVARWMNFPWDHIVDTRFAFGEGLSYASRVPALEPRAGREGEDSVRLLNYLLVEWEFMLPQRAEQHAQWSVFTRIHHRSGVAGLFGNVRGGSNFVTIGARYTF